MGKVIIINSKKYGRHEVLVDDEDFELVSKYRWCLAVRGKTRYAYCIEKENRSVIIYMHRLILANPAQHVDHKDQNGLNNQKSNLRLGSKAQNLMNRGVNKNNKTGFKGVSFNPRTKKYRVAIMYKRKWISGGEFINSSLAAKRYNELALRHFGEFAKLNTIPNE